MNLQDAASLTIPEGGVRNIRDGNGNLLWSSVGYNVRYDGNTYQQTYSGANLFNYTDTNNVGTVTTVSEDGFITQSKDNSSGTSSVFNNYFTHNLALDTSTTYAIVIEVQAVSGTGSLVPVNNHSSAQSTIQLEYPFSDLHAGDIIVGQFKTKSSFSGDSGIRSYTRYGAGESGSITYRISVLADTSVTPETFVYQPYTGGIPAPNPDYPQPIQAVTGVQTIKVTGKNLWGGFINDYSLTDHDVAFVNYKDGSISANGTANSAAYSMYATAASSQGRLQQFPAGTYTLSGGTNAVRIMFIIVGPGTYYITDTTTGKVTFTLSETVSGYIRAYVPSGTSANETIHPQLEKGFTASAYERYQSQSYIVDLGPIELCKIGDYQDYIYKSGDDWYVHKAVDKNVLDGSNDEGYSLQSSTDITQTFQLTNFVFIETPPENTPVAMSNQYLPSTNSNVYGTNNLAFAFNINGYLRFNLRKTTASDVTGLRTWLGTNNLIIYYPLVAATDIKITDATLISQLDAAHNWLIRHDYSGTVSGNLPIIINRTGLI